MINLFVGPVFEVFAALTPAGDYVEQAEESAPGKADVTRRAAHNLALIFRRSGAHLLADQIRRDFSDQERTHTDPEV